jgi:hypothetical protein
MTELKQGSGLVQIDSGGCLKRPLLWGQEAADSYVLVSVFIHVSSYYTVCPLASSLRRILVCPLATFCNQLNARHNAVQRLASVSTALLMYARENAPL